MGPVDGALVEDEVIGRFSSTTLAGEPLTVPDDLTGPTLLLVAYVQAQQVDVDTWLRAVPEGAGVRPLEVPVLARRWRPVRRLIDGGMASNMDERTRAQTMCVYTDVDAFRREVLGSTSAEVQALLVDADGVIRWRASGPATPDGVQGLTAAITALG